MGQSVLVENTKSEPKWVLGTVLEKLGDISYRIQVGHQIWKRHIDQLLQTTITEDNNDNTDDSSDELNSWSFTSNVSSTNQQSEQKVRRYPTRFRRPPDRYSPSNN